MGKPRTLTREVLEDAAARGMGPRSAAVFLRVTVPAIYRAERAVGVRLPRGAPLRRVSDRDLVLLDAEGLTVSQIAQKTNVARETVERRLGRIPVCDREAILREAGATAEPVLPVMPPHPFWTPARDAIVLRSGGSWTALRDVAEHLGKSLSAVTARWHLLRGAR